MMHLSGCVPIIKQHKTVIKKLKMQKSNHKNKIENVNAK